MHLWAKAKAGLVTWIASKTATNAGGVACGVLLATTLVKYISIFDMFKSGVEYASLVVVCIIICCAGANGLSLIYRKYKMAKIIEEASWRDWSTIDRFMRGRVIRTFENPSMLLLISQGVVIERREQGQDTDGKRLYEMDYFAHKHAKRNHSRLTEKKRPPVAT